MAETEICGVAVLCDRTGALYLPDCRLLVVSDLHLEKGAAFARRGQLLPPYDTLATLDKLEAVIRRYDPATVISLGDSFHDRIGARLLSAALRQRIADLARGRDWIWINGNHDPDGVAAAGPPDPAGPALPFRPGAGPGQPPATVHGAEGTAPRLALPGMDAETFAIAGLTFRHEPSPGPAGKGEIAGHLHPAATVRRREKSVRRACFAGDGERLILPAFGVTTGGLDLRHKAFAGLFARERLIAHLLGRDRIYSVRFANLIG